MNTLFKIALSNPRHLFLVGFTVVAMFFLTIASQMEILTMGILAQKGPGFFELFVADNQGREQLLADPIVTKEQLEARWKQIDVENKGYISKAEVAHYVASQKKQGLVDKAIFWINRVLPIDGKITYLALLVGLVGFFKAITLFCYRFATKVVAIRVSRDLRQKYFEHLQMLPMSFYQKHNIGGLSSRVVTDALVIAEGINATLINYLQTPFTIITTLTLCFFTSWQLSLIIFLGFPMIICPIVFLARKVKRISKQLQKNQEAFASVLIDFLAGIQTIKIFAMEEFSLKKYREQNNRMAVLQQKSARYDVSSRPIVHTIAMFFLAVTLLSGLYLLQMNIAEVLVYCGFLYIFYEPVKKFAEENSAIQKGAAAAERMNEVLSIHPQIQDHKGSVALDTLHDTLEFDDVWFRYSDSDDWVLKGISFSVKRGQTVAITGPTGAGKSTIVQLIPRLYEVQKGEIRINGKPIQTFTQKSLRENITFVPQKPFLFLDTVAENITFGRSYPRERIQLAARQAYAEEFIEKLSLKYDTALAESGKNLSVGQQQRLAIARALLKEAPILIMDEATSSLDAISENHIKTAIQQLHGKKTQIIIAHRLSTIEDADKIIYMESGQKIAEGTKEELLLSCPGFRLMWEMMHKPKRTRDEIDKIDKRDDIPVFQA